METSGISVTIFEQKTRAAASQDPGKSTASVGLVAKSSDRPARYLGSDISRVLIRRDGRDQYSACSEWFLGSPLP
jgi:hypothetical protein